MQTKRIWRRLGEERRGRRRIAANFYAIELEGRARYLRRVTNVSGDGLLLENPLGDDRPGQVLELELPRKDDQALRVQGEVVYVTEDGHVGVRVTSAPLPVDGLGGRLPL
jgi:hypothetical protein